MNNLALSDEILLKIEKPVRYIGNEVNMVRKDPEGKIRFAMCFPDVYEIGMSHLGMKIIYDQMNRRDDVYCERVFSPWVDLDKVMREENIPLFALESQDPVFMFDFLAVTIQYEMCYTNILQILDLSQIGIYAKDRREDAPFVIGGGILIALAFLLDDYSIDPSNFGKNTPLAAYLKTIGEQAFGMMLPILAGFIAMSIADRPGLAVGLVAGLIAKMGSTFANPAGGDVNAGFLGALFAGFAGGYLVLGLKKLFSKLPKSLEGIKPVLLYPVIGIFLAAVVTTFINPYMGMINDGLTHFLNGMGGTSRVMLGMILGGMMSIDMGGPFNKAAYVFGTAQLAEGNFEVMAAVMAGGMVPPLAIALCTTFFKKKFTEKERQSGVVNYVMGLSFITEGAIPFAAQDPLRVIPSCLIGSAIAGGLSMAFGCTLRAPHGGLFVLPTIGNPVMYLVAVVTGAVVSCVILGVLKKNVEE